jgi:hypothetical protein
MPVKNVREVNGGSVPVRRVCKDEWHGRDAANMTKVSASLPWKRL